MSGKYSSIVTFVFLVAIALAANQAEENARDAKPAATAAGGGRGPASVMSKKGPLVAASEAPMFRHTEKIHGPLAASIQLLGDRPAQPGDVFTLKATIQSMAPLTDVDFTWSLPVGLQHVNGELRGRLNRIFPGQPVELQITVKTQTGEDHQVSLLTAATRNGTRFADSVQYSTLLEPAMEASRQQMKAATAKAALESSGGKSAELKVFH